VGRSPNIYQWQCIRDWSTGGCAGGKLSIEFRVHKRKSNNLTYSHDFPCAIGRNLPFKPIPSFQCWTPHLPWSLAQKMRSMGRFWVISCGIPFLTSKIPLQKRTDHYAIYDVHWSLSAWKPRIMIFQMWVWINTYRYIFSGMNIHSPAILMFTRGTRFWPIPMLTMLRVMRIASAAAKSSFLGETFLLRPLSWTAVRRASEKNRGISRTNDCCLYKMRHLPFPIHFPYLSYISGSFRTWGCH